MDQEFKFVQTPTRQAIVWPVAVMWIGLGIIQEHLLPGQAKLRRPAATARLA